jgi:hypothetical protein
MFSPYPIIPSKNDIEKVKKCVNINTKGKRYENKHNITKGAFKPFGFGCDPVGDAVIEHGTLY